LRGPNVLSLTESHLIDELANASRLVVVLFERKRYWPANS
jgi:hypothetical protein